MFIRNQAVSGLMVLHIVIGSATKRRFIFAECAGLRRRKKRGFTLVELLVVMAIIALLLAIVTPRYFGSVEKAKEAVLKEDLVLMRDVIDKYYVDTKRYPSGIEELVEKKYLRRIPVDPLTESAATWRIISPENPEFGSMYDVKSGASGVASDGTSYSEW